MCCNTPCRARIAQWSHHQPLWLLCMQLQQLLAPPALQAAEYGAADGGGGAQELQDAERPAGKMCSKCRAQKPGSEFFRDKSKHDGLYSQVGALPAEIDPACMHALHAAHTVMVSMRPRPPHWGTYFAVRLYAGTF